MLKWLKSLFCIHNEVVTVVYYVADLAIVTVCKEYTCKHCGKTWIEHLSKYVRYDIPKLKRLGIKSIEEVYNERTCQ